MKPETVGSSTIYEGRVVKLDIDKVKLEDGKVCKREVVRHAPAVCVFAYDKDYGYLVNQYRHPVGEYITEAVAGLCERGEEPSYSALRELNEEIDALADDLIPLGTFYSSPGFTDEIIYLYAAEITGWKKGTPDEDEHINVKKYKLSELKQMAIDGTITDGKTVTVLLKFFALHDKTIKS